jgi:heterodisulfide reductase subunit D
MRLEQCSQEVWMCNHCSMCTETVSDEAGWYRTCPVYGQLRFEDSSARGHNTVAFYLLEGSLKYSQRVAESVYACTTCASCEEVCSPFGNVVAKIGGSALKTMVPPIMGALGAEMDTLHTVEIVEAMRADCVDLGLQPEPLKKMAESTDKNGNPYGEPQSDRLKWAEGLDIPDAAETVLFVGCTPSYRTREIAQSTAKILKRAGVKFAVLPDEWCCGSPLLRAGNVDLGGKMIKHNVDLLAEKGVKRVIAPCAECYMAIARDWPKTAGALPFSVHHISEFLARLISARRIRFRNQIKSTVTYHDPCHLGRAMGIYDEPRSVLKAIPGVELVEMYPTGHAAWCCGAGGGMKASNPDLALDIGVEKVPLIVQKGASVLASSCPFCKTNFVDAMQKAKVSVTVKDLTELVAESMGV